MAGSTRLELAASCVTGRRSNQLNYDPEQITYISLSSALLKPTTDSGNFPFVQPLYYW